MSACMLCAKALPDLVSAPMMRTERVSVGSIAVHLLCWYNVCCVLNYCLPGNKTVSMVTIFPDVLDTSGLLMNFFWIFFVTMDSSIWEMCGAGKGGFFPFCRRCVST